MGKPPAPEPAELTEAGPRTFRIVWEIPDSDPEVTACTIRIRIQGSQKWQNYDHTTGQLVGKGGATVPADTKDVTIEGCEEGIHYEVVVAAMNKDGWGEVSKPSKPACIGEARPRQKPERPSAPKLTALGSGKMKCAWDIPEACPPVEACQLQLTDMGKNKTFLVHGAKGTLVQSGQTTIAVPRCEASVNGTEDGVEYVAQVCCRNAEGFGEYSMQSDSAIFVNTSAGGEGNQLVLHSGPTESGAPVLEPMSAGQAKMKVLWIMPEDAKSTMVKIRRVGDQNWYLCGGSAVKAPEFETVAVGLEEGIEYEATCSFLTNNKWSPDSPLSKPRCIGEKLQPAVPSAPKEPILRVVDQSRMAVRWRLVTAVPAVTGSVIRFRELGSREWMHVDPGNGLLIEEPLDDPLMFKIPQTEVTVVDLKPGLRYEAAIALKNKLGLGVYSPSSDICCIGRPYQKLMTCNKCELDYDLQHGTYSKPAETFWCPICRFRHMDPFNEVVEPYGFLLCHIVARPLIVFSIDLPDLKSWRKDEELVFLRMVKVNSETSTQCWPRTLTFEANGNEVFKILEPEEGHVRRDVPINISSGLKSGMNAIRITIEDDMPSAFAISLVRTLLKNPTQLSQNITICDEETAKDRVMRLMAPEWKKQADAAEKAVNDAIAGAEDVKNGDENKPDEEKADDNGSDNEADAADISVTMSNKLRLRCPLSFERVCIPVRGQQCMHLQCFGLGAYLESNSKMRALNNRWTCPVCNSVLKPEDLRIDAYVERVLAETPSHIDEVAIQENGTYLLVEEDEAEKMPAASPGADDKDDMDDAADGANNDASKRKADDSENAPAEKKQKTDGQEVKIRRESAAG